MRPKFGGPVVTLLLCLLAALAVAQAKQPNLSGTWKMNAEKSKFEQGGPSEIIITFDHKDVSLSESLKLTTPNGDRTVETKYVTDGKEATQEVMGAATKTFAKWEGDALIIDWKVEGANFNRKLTLSADGKTITMIVKQSSPDGQSATDTVVLEKQEAKK